jgi:hypothetical protein
VDTFLNYLQRMAFGRARHGYRVQWWVIALSIGVVRRARHRDAVVFRTKLEPGESLIVSTLKPTSTKSRGR